MQQNILRYESIEKALINSWRETIRMLDSRMWEEVFR
jgi:hypothetical protein